MAQSTVYWAVMGNGVSVKYLMNPWMNLMTRRD